MLPLATIFMDLIVLSFSMLLFPFTISKDGLSCCKFFLEPLYLPLRSFIVSIKDLKIWIEFHGIFLGYTLKHLPFAISTLGQSNNIGIYFSSSPTLPFASSKLSISCQHFSCSSRPSWVTASLT